MPFGVTPRDRGYFTACYEYQAWQALRKRPPLRVRPATHARFLRFFSDHWPPDLAWPADIPRPAQSQPVKRAS